ncbi:MAG: hypothetical protein ACO1O1_07770 [Adhaeribacter sp.]
MKKPYHIIVGIALLATIAACYAFKNTRYYSVKTGEEFTAVRYEKYKQEDEFNFLVREESFLNYEAGFTAGMVSLGLGFLFIGLTKKKGLK